ncbi:leucyl-tRNA synthetase [Phaeosphaeriaceae sp. SRC1lsM3a]|nr:leucyl-tRNA synthetase [Stagonospora sp. SRC1lsM3a]
MVRFSLQRVCWRGSPSRLTRPCIRRASQWTATAAERKQRADEIKLESLTAKWQPHWDHLEASKSTQVKSSKGHAYVLPMFPYPSGTLHLGHLRVYTISDVLARFKRMQGYDVLHPFGWDAFGLPAENAAIERGVHPEKWTLQNIEAMKSQIKLMGGSWNWESEIRTCDPDYYKHTQRIFLMLYERGLAYQAESLVNYDPVDKTVLANEQVDANGCSWRSGAKVEKLMLKQWFLKIKEFQDPLLKDLDALAKDGKWPEKVVAMQKNWLGKSEGTKLAFKVRSAASDQPFDHLEVFTTRVDTLFGVQYLALSLGHPIVQQEALNNSSLRTFIERAKELPPDSKEGFLLPNVTAENPIAGLVPNIQATLPVYVAPYVLDDYGSGAVMGVPGHDIRDHAFWRANAGHAPIQIVVATKPGKAPLSLTHGSEQDRPMTAKGFITADIESFKGWPSHKAAKQLVSMLKKSGQFVEQAENWRLRDWLISRQRYWGAPIPIIHCGSCGPVPVPEQDLPVVLPNLPDSFFSGKKGNPLAEDETWKKTQCPKCGSAAERETDTMDTFMDSSWYFFRFLDAKNETALVDPRKANEGMPVDLYVGGVEHAILHLLYARFISKFLASTSTWPEGKAVNGEPFKQLLTQGMVHGETFTDPANGRFLRPDELDLSVASRPLIKATGQPPTVSFEKMSKSKYNGVDPAVTIANFGADATRAHMLFQAPMGDVLEWDAKKITGVQRWLSRLVRLAAASGMSEGDLVGFQVPTDPDLKLHGLVKQLENNNTEIFTQREVADLDERLRALLSKQDMELWVKTQRTIASVTESYSETYSLNTIVSDLMILTNAINDTPQSSIATSYLKWYSLAHLSRMVAPIAPGVAEEAWHLLKGTTMLNSTRETSDHINHSVFAAGFPIADLDIIPRLTHTTKCVVQVDGKRKFDVEIEKLSAETSIDREEMTRSILAQLLETKEGKDWLARESGVVWKLSQTKQPHPVFKIVPDDWQVIIVGDGRLCNLVRAKSKKTKNATAPSAEPVDGVATQQ